MIKVGDLVRYKHFPNETGVVIKIHTAPAPPEKGGPSIDLLTNTGEVAVCLDPDAFEIVS